MNIQPMPTGWAMNVDLIPLLEYQKILDADRELFCGGMRVSSQLTPTTSDTKQIGDYTVQSYDSNTNTTFLTFGDEDDPTLFSEKQKAICNDIQSIAGVERITIKERGLIHNLPPDIENNKLFEGAEKIYQMEESQGNFPHLMRQKTGLGRRLTNVNTMITNEMLDKGLISNPNQVIIRSTLITKWLLDDLHIGIQGWRLFDPHTNPGILLKTLRGIRNKPTALYPTRTAIWNRDTALPKVFVLPYNAHGVDGNVFKLEDRKEYVFLGHD